jgi:uncharacterized membrane protein
MVPAASWAGLALAAWWLWSHRDGLGPLLVTHYDWQGHPDGWRSNTPEALLTPIVVGAFAVAIVAMATWLLARASSREAAPPGTRPKDPRAAVRVLLTTEIVVAAVAILGALAPLVGATPLLVAACFAVPIALIGYVLAMAPDPAGEGSGHAANDAHWRGGVFYVNRDDEAVWVPKRSGLGYTLNFAHRTSWFILALLLLFPVLIIIISMQSLRR